MTARRFHLGDLLSISHDRLMSPRHIDGVYDILGWLTGDTLFTHQLPAAGLAAKPHLLEQHPWLADVEIGDVDETNFDAVLTDLVWRWGDQHDVEPMPSEVWGKHNPIADLVEMVGPERVIVVETDSPTSEETAAVKTVRKLTDN